MSSPPPLDPALFELEGALWVMGCAESPVPKASVAAIHRFLPIETQPWTLRWKEDFLGIPEAVKRAAGPLLGGAAADDLSLVSTTSAGLVAVAQGFPWREGDEVVIAGGEFPSNVYPWKALAARGVGLREVALWEGHRWGRDAVASTPPDADARPEDRLLAALGDGTRILAVSWVRFQDGLILDLSRLARGCRERGVALVVDGIQGAGLLPVELDGLAAFCTGGHKGLLTPQGVGLLWTAPDFRARLAPSGTWLSVEEGTSWDRPASDTERAWAEDGSRFEAGVPNLLGCAAFRASLELLAGVGVEALAAHVATLRRRLLDGLDELLRWRTESRRLRELDAAGRLGPLVSLPHRGSGEEALQALVKSGRRRGIFASVREGYLRIAFHGWHSAEDVDRLLDWLARYVGSVEAEPA